MVAVANPKAMAAMKSVMGNPIARRRTLALNAAIAMKRRIAAQGAGS